MASYPGTPPTISQATLSPNYYFQHVSTDTTNYIARWELYDNGSQVNPNAGFAIRWNSTSGKNEINVNDPNSPYLNTDAPAAMKINNGTLTPETDSWHEIQNGDSIQFYETGGYIWGDSWTVATASHLFTASSGGASGSNSGNQPSTPSIPSSIRKNFSNFW